MRHCPSCGQSVPDTAQHCPHCGQALIKIRLPIVPFILFGIAFVTVGVILFVSFLLRQSPSHEMVSTNFPGRTISSETPVNTVPQTVTEETVQATTLPADRIVFMSDSDGDFEIYTVNIDGSGLIKLTDNSANDLNPVWSPDGKRIAFYSARDGNSEIYVMNADGSGVIRLTNNQAGDSAPDWSPDGSQLVFYSDRDGIGVAPLFVNQEIYVMNADGSQQTRLTDEPAFDSSPDWSPDGKRIAFESWRDPVNGKTDTSSEIYVMNVDGSGLTRLTNNVAKDHTPQWSPDGTQILFMSDRDGNDEIYVMNADGSEQTNLTSNPANDYGGRWSPDGEYIIFTSDRDGNPEIYLMKANGSDQTRLTNNPAIDVAADWQP